VIAVVFLGLLALGAIVCGLRDVLKECVFLGYERYGE
jgi:hypothetical protein